MNVYPMIASSILINCYQWEFCLPWKTHTKEPMELVVISNLLALDVRKSRDQYENLISGKAKIYIVWVTFRFSSLVYGLYVLLCFWSTKVDWWIANKNIIFSWLHFCLPFCFVFLRMCSCESWNFKILCVSEKQSSTYIIPLYERRKSKYSVVL